MPQNPRPTSLLHAPARHLALIPKWEYNRPHSLVQHRVPAGALRALRSAGTIRRSPGKLPRLSPSRSSMEVQS